MRTENEICATRTKGDKVNTTRILMLLLGISCLLPAQDRITDRQHADFQTGDTIRLKNSTGELTIEGWDQPGVEIDTAKWATRQDAVRILNEVKVGVSRQGGELVITTDFPRHRR